ncbi:cobalt/nickel transport system ATP-binding protein [Methanobacterium petrolearium]|nr:cobalt/nickel transport system ATP-binding protein [Methanobacterium petrolearium]BDZ71033.1 cobalt transporter ATP-binding subunit [Methanobacterium petrolearium]
MGPNGAGKSTLFLHFNGILKPSSGTVVVDGKPMNYDKNGLVQVRQKVGLVFQNPDDQLFAPTVSEDVAFGPLNIGLHPEEVQKRVSESLEKVGMAGYEDKPPHHLSGGQKKRVSIAGILAMRPEIMVLDEPTSGLDPKGAFQIMKLLIELNREGMTIVIATHDVDIVPIYAHKVYAISKGEIIKEGSPHEIFEDVQTIRDANLRLPHIAHLFERLHKEDEISFGRSYPLTVNEAKDKITDKIKDNKSL